MKSPFHPARAFLARFGRLHIILPVSVLNSAAYTIVALGFVFYLRDRLGASAATIGLASASFNALYFVGCFVLRPFGLRLLPRYSLIVSSFVASSLLVLLILASHVWVVVALYAAVGFVLALFWPPVMGWLSAGAEGHSLNRRISYFNLAWSSGVIVGPLIAGLLAERRIDLPLFVGAGMIGVVGAVVLAASLFLTGIRTDTHRDRKASPLDAPDRSTPLRFPAWIGLVPSYTVLGALMIIIPLHARDHLHLAESAVGAVLLLRGLAASVGFLILGRWSGWHFRTLPTLGATAALIPLLLALRAGGSLLSYVIVLPLVGLMVASSYTFSVYYGVSGTSDRTRRMAIHEALLTVGAVAGAIGAGRLYEVGGAPAAFLGCVVVLAVGLVAQGVSVVVLRRQIARDRAEQAASSTPSQRLS